MHSFWYVLRASKLWDNSSVKIGNYVLFFFFSLYPSASNIDYQNTQDHT